jgi:predicted lipoprotein with Yx(FWY)xxD motif
MRAFLVRGVWLAGAAVLVAGCGSGSVTGASTSATGSAEVVHLDTATVDGSREQVLTNAQGFTLYHLTADGPSNPTCTGPCAVTWPPLLLSSGQPTASGTLPQGLIAFTGADGRQVEYGGHPLYRYSGDSAPGQTNGEGLLGEWFVVTPGLAAAPGAGVSPTATSGSYGSGY